MKIIKLLVLIAVLTVFPLASFADSPATSTTFSDAYMDIKMVEEAQNKGVMDEEIAMYLTSPKVSIDVKAAVINAIYNSTYWSTKANADEFSLLTYNKPVAELDFNQLGADELFCLGYLTLLDNYDNPEQAINILELAKTKNEQSFTVSMILAIAKAQNSGFSNDIWQLTDQVLNDDTLTKDMRTEAVDVIVDYMILYKDEDEDYFGNYYQNNDVSGVVDQPTAIQNQITVYVNGQLVDFDVPPTVDPQSKRTLVPFRQIFEALDADVWYDSSTNTANGRKGDLLIKLPIGFNSAYVNGQYHALDVAAKIINGRTVIPLRFVSEAMGCEVTTAGDLTNLTIYITSQSDNPMVLQ